MTSVRPNHCLVAAAAIGLVNPDQMSDVRYVHASSLRAQAGSTLQEDELAAYHDYVYSAGYLETLMRQRLYGAWIDRTLVATGGWSVADDHGSAVRVRSLAVRPGFFGTGLGAMMLAEVENDARAAGFAAFQARAPSTAVSFFLRHGYIVTSQGVQPLPAVSPAASHAVALPVTFMRKSDSAAQGDAG
jgi:GNAT superfamily N-acetyltransferase